MDVKELFATCVDASTGVVGLVRPGDFGKPTPDTEWDVRALASHMLYELSWAGDILAGRTVSEVGSRYDGDLIEDDLMKSWNAARDRAMGASREAALEEVIHLSYGDFPARHYLIEQANDQLIHGWDLAQGLGKAMSFDEAVARFLYEQAWPRQEELAESGLFAPVIKVAESADIQTKLLGLYGRQEHWR
jgi:uncharacterized protein (TIGR03086 family)